MIKAVIFDIDETLYHFSGGHQYGMKAIESYAEETLHISAEQLRDAIAQAQKIMGTRLGYDNPAFHNRQIRFQNALEYLNLPIYPHANKMYALYWGEVNGRAVPEPGLVELLKELKKRNVHLGIGSDMTSYIQNDKLEKMKIAEYFDAVVTSEEAGKDKPDRAIFELCIEKAKCKPEECLFIGDRIEKDYKGAIAAGMQAFCYGKYSGEVPENREHLFTSYEELSRVLGGMLG